MMGVAHPSVADHDILSWTAFERHLDRLRGTPEWVTRFKRDSWERFEELPLPARTDEKWRFANTRSLSLFGYRTSNAVRPVAGEALFDWFPMDNPAGRLAFVDDRVVQVEEPASYLRKKGVVWVSLEEAFTRHGDILQEHLMAITPDLGSEKFQALHGALLRSGTLLYVPRGVEIKRPFVAQHSALEDSLALFPHTLIIAEEQVQVNLVDVFMHTTAAPRQFVCGCASIIAGPGSQVSYKAVQDWNLKTTSLHLNVVRAHRDSTVRTMVLNLGSKYLRSEHHSRIEGAGANVESYSLSVPSGSQEFDQRTLQTHEAPQSRSNLLYKNALMDRSRTIFSGLIRVDETAQQTDAYQTNRNLLLSEEAEANSLPGLEILANDVKCSHGATTGRIDRNQLYYLLSRGIHRHVAEQLLVFGFLDEIVDKIDDLQLREKMSEIVKEKLSNRNAAN